MISPKLFILLLIIHTYLIASINIITTSKYKINENDTQTTAMYKALQLAKENATEEAGIIIQSKFNKHLNSDGFDFSEYDLETISSSIITKILDEYQKDGYYFIKIRATVDISNLYKYKDDFEAIRKKVSNNKQSTPKINKLAREMANLLQKIIDQNNGKIKVVNNIYMTRVFAYRNTVNVYYTIIKEELIRSIILQREISYAEAYKLTKSKKFIDNVKILYPINFNNSYCNNKPIRDALKNGMEIYSNISWDDGKPIINFIKVNGNSCIDHEKNEDNYNKLFQNTLVKYEKPKVGFEKVIEKLQSKLPIKVDKMTTLLSVIALEKKIIYRYSLNETGNFTFIEIKKNKALIKKNIEKMTQSALCNKEETKNVLIDGAVFEYIYMLDNTEYFVDFKISLKSCYE